MRQRNKKQKSRYIAKHHQIPIIVIYVLGEVVKSIKEKSNFLPLGFFFFPVIYYAAPHGIQLTNVLINWGMLTSRIVYKTWRCCPNNFTTENGEQEPLPKKKFTCKGKILPFYLRVAAALGDSCDSANRSCPHNMEEHCHPQPT
jgi:hypothetical protein